MERPSERFRHSSTLMECLNGLRTIWAHRRHRLIKKSSRPAYSREDSTKERKTEVHRDKRKELGRVPLCLHLFPICIVRVPAQSFHASSHFLAFQCLVRRLG